MRCSAAGEPIVKAGNPGSPSVYSHIDSRETQYSYVWAVDGRLEYGHYPHITVMLAALACLLLLWLPYTLLLLVMQWLRKTPNFMLSRWITRYKPVFDAYYAPLKDKHHYWFGVLLLVRGILLLVFSSTANVNPAISLFLLLGLTILLLCYMNYQHVYKSKSVMILESSFLINLILLVGVVLQHRRRRKCIQNACTLCVNGRCIH